VNSEAAHSRSPKIINFDAENDYGYSSHGMPILSTLTVRKDRDGNVDAIRPSFLRRLSGISSANGTAETTTTPITVPRNYGYPGHVNMPKNDKANSNAGHSSFCQRLPLPIAFGKTSGKNKTQADISKSTSKTLSSTKRLGTGA
jgi:hypothetical protein